MNNNDNIDDYLASSNQENTYICTRCGNPVKISSRYCMKCGQVNLNHPDNASFIKKTHADKNQGHYQIGKGSFLQETSVDTNTVVTAQAINSGNVRNSFLFNYLFFFILLIGVIAFSLLGKEISFYSVLASPISSLIMMISISFLYSYSFQLLFIKCNQKWWYAFIPIYNMMIISEIVFKNKIFGLLLFVPILGEIYFLLLFYQLGKKFQYSGILTLLFFPIYLLLISYGNHYFEGRLYVDSNQSVEKDYKMIKRYLSTMIFIFLIGLGAYFYANFSNVTGEFGNVGNYYYVNAGKKIVEKTKKATESSKVECDDVDYSIIGASYMFYFPDVAKEVYLPLGNSRDLISSYVMVTFKDDRTVEYKVALSDESKKIDLVSIENLSVENVSTTDHNSVLGIQYPNMCHILSK